LTALLRGELIKVRTTRTALGFGLASVLLLLAYVLVGILAGDPTEASEKRESLNVGGVLSIPLLIFGIVGATGEYRHRTLAPAVLIAPDRFRLTLARLLAYMLTALAVGVAMLVVALGVGLPLLASQPGSDLTGEDYATIIGGGLIVATLTTALGVGVGVLVRNQVAGVVGALIWLFILSPLLGLIDEALPTYTTLPAAGIAGGAAAPDEDLTWTGAVVVLVVWALVFNVLGLIAEKRRDID
jgi:ABC-2 type transport system permease protein